MGGSATRGLNDPTKRSLGAKLCVRSRFLEADEGSIRMINYKIQANSERMRNLELQCRVAKLSNEWRENSKSFSVGRSTGRILMAHALELEKLLKDFQIESLNIIYESVD